MTLTLPLGTLGAVASLLAATSLSKKSWKVLLTNV
jgi:hypothetical protein